MKSLFRTISHRRQSGRRTFTDTAEDAYKTVRDRGLDHAVEREKNLRPLVSMKDLIRSEPAKSIPISVITNQKDSLRVPLRPIEFIRSYPSVFQEFLPGGIGVHPHISLTPEVLNIDAEEQLVYGSESYKQGLADRLLKLLMINRINKIPLEILDLLKWDLGLPQNYAETMVPEFPDYFRVIKSKLRGCSGELELVCWSDEHSVSVLEKKATTGKGEYSKGSAIAFPMKFSNGFVVDKKMKKWIDEWQKLPYISPYENALHLSATSDESDKWTAAVLHEIVNLFVTKKVEKDSILHLGEFMGMRSRFKRVIHHHPGIFYLSSKLRTHTVVLRDAYKRGTLIENNELVTSRNSYMKLMNKAKKKENKAVFSRKREDKGKVEGEVCDTDAKAENDDVSGSEVEDEREENVVDDDEEDDSDNEVDQNQSLKRGRGRRKPSLKAGRRSFGKSDSQEKPRSRRNLKTERRSPMY